MSGVCVPQWTHAARWTKQWRWTDTWTTVFKDILSSVECTMKLCSDLKRGTPLFVSELRGICFLPAVSLLLLEDLCIHRVNAVLDDEPSDCDTQMNVIKAVAHCFVPPGRRWAKVRVNYLLADCTLRKGQHQKDCGNIEAFTQELMHSSSCLF